MTNLALKYRPKSFEDVVEQDNVVKILQSMCKQPELPNRNFLLVGPRGCGKAQPENALVLTPEGFIMMSDVNVGTKVITANDNIGVVSKIFPQGKRQCYRLEFDDGGWCEVADNHINYMEYSYDGISYQHQDITTLDLLSEFKSKNKKKIWGVKTVSCKFDDSKTLSAEDIPNNYITLLSQYRHWVVSSIDSRKYIFKKLYNDFGVYNDSYKYVFNISDIYDSAEMVLEFVSRSLGYTLVKHGHTVEVNVNDIHHIRKLVNIKKIGYKKCKCIYIDHEDHSYITDDFIPTHNTTLGRIVANEINEGKGNPFELDAASNNGVDSVRKLVEEARSYPIGSKYKVFICDECFPRGSWISTPRGNIKIEDIKPNDTVYNLTGEATVSQVFKNHVKPSNLIAIKLDNGKYQITTKDHMIFTDNGWIKAKDLVTGDCLYDYETLCSVRKGFSSRISERPETVLLSGVSQSLDEDEDDRSSHILASEEMSYLWKDLLDSQVGECYNMLYEMLCSVEKRTQKYSKTVRATCEALAYVYVSDMRETNGNTKQRSSQGMQSRMRDKAENEGEFSAFQNILSGKSVRGMWEFIQCELLYASAQDLQRGMPTQTSRYNAERSEIARIFCEDEVKQPNVQSRNSQKSYAYQRKEWDIAQSACLAWWKRATNKAADSFEKSTRECVGVRVSGKDISNYEKVSGTSLSYELQTRPCLSGYSVGGRGRWSRPQYEIATVAGRKEGNVPPAARVESVEIYESGNNDKLFRSCFTDKQLHSDYVEMFDLQVNGHPSYIVNDILVHNCHSFSNTAWQVLLKPLEDQPASSVFILLTTNPEKIPKTILSRVQKFQLSNISLDGITHRLKYVLDSEISEGRNITYDEKALQYIAKLAKGGMRDSLTLLDKALVYSNDVTFENIQVSLGIPDYNDYFDLLNAYAKKDNLKIIQIVEKIYNSGTNFVKWFEEFQSFTINIVKYVYLHDITETTIPITYEEKMKKYGPKHAQICLNLSQIMVEMISKLSRTEYMEEVADSYLMRK